MDRWPSLGNSRKSKYVTIERDNAYFDLLGLGVSAHPWMKTRSSKPDAFTSLPSGIIVTWGDEPTTEFFTSNAEDPVPVADGEVEETPGASVQGLSSESIASAPPQRQKKRK